MKEFQREEIIYVAVGIKLKETVSILKWALENSGGKTVSTIQVHQHGKEANTFRVSREEKPRDAFSNAYLRSYLKSYVHGESIEKIYIEADSIEKGIVQFVEQHNIGNLVIGAAADVHYSRKMTEVKSEKAIYVRDHAPSFCRISFICNGHLIHTREKGATNLPKSSPALVPPEREGEAGSSTVYSDPIPSRQGTDIIDGAPELAVGCRSPSSMLTCKDQNGCNITKANNSFHLLKHRSENPAILYRPKNKKDVKNMMSFKEAQGMEKIVREEKMYIAVSNDTVKDSTIWAWAMVNSDKKKICTIHVRQVSIPKKEVQYFNEVERDDGQDKYPQSELGKESLYIEAESIEQGIIQLVERHNIRELVMGAAADKHRASCNSKMTELRSKKAIYVRDNAPPTCHIWFICNAHLIYTREVINPPEPTPGEDVLVSDKKDEGAGSPSASCYRFPSRLITDNIDDNAPEFASDYLTTSSSMSTMGNDSESSSNDHIYDQLVHDVDAAENSRRDAVEKLMALLKAEKEASADAIREAETVSRLYYEESRLRKAMEEELAALKEERKLWSKTSNELQATQFQKLALERQIEKSNISMKELEGKLLSAVELSHKHEKELEELRQQLNQGPSNSPAAVLISAFSYSDLEKATKNFDPSLIIGKGGYGSIYKGFLRHTEVAIKKLNPDSSQGSREFDQEVEVASKVQHPNLVTLIGVCPEQLALVYEYLSGGSLEDRLDRKNNAPPLPWQIRVRIATELCSALIFLHSSRPGRIIHGDLKPANILLDENCVCKLSDFGISHVVLNGETSTEQTTSILTINVRGTFAYMDPAILTTGELTAKSDVYSFGIILLRLLTGKVALRIAIEVEFALANGTFSSIIDPSAGDWPIVQAEQLARLGLRCCTQERKNRPDLRTDVWRILLPMKASCQNLSIHRVVSENQVPNYFICPIFQAIMHDPHIASDGFTYEKEAIKTWLDGWPVCSPMTNQPLANTVLTPNRSLRSAIQEWLQHHQID